MSLIRAKIGQRALFAVAVLIFTALSIGVFRAETRKEWMAYQGEFQKMNREMVLARINDPETDKDPAARGKWEKQLREVNAMRIRIHRIFLPDANVRDLCTTCHLGIDNPLFADAPEPFRSHPGKVLEQHPMEKFGCTLCHKGQGVGTSTHAAHGLEETWFDPLIPTQHLQSTCIGCHETSYGLEGTDKLDDGRQIFEKYGCYGCHTARGLEDPLMFGPTFEDLGKKLADEKWMLSWLRAPKKMRPETTMPAFQLDDDEMRDITAFVLSLDAEKEYAKVDLLGTDVQEGEKLFTDLGCRACHSSMRDEKSLKRRIPNLSGAGVKLSPDWLFEYLKDPKVYNPETRMPKLDITEADRKNLTAYLTTARDNMDLVDSETLSTRGASIENGGKLVQLHGCYGCHQVEAFAKAPLPGVEVAEVAHKVLEELPFGYSTVNQTKWDWIYNKIESPKIFETEDMPLKMPEYSFEEGELEAMTTYYLDNDLYHLPGKYLSAATPWQTREQTGEWLITENNCRGCHMFDENVKPRIDEFTGLKTYVPPRLLGEGEKVQPQWIFQYLSMPVPMRPWLKMRMPNFSFPYQDVESLIEHFSTVATSRENARVPYVLLPQRADIPQLEIDMGEYRVLADKCMQCHPISLDEELPEDINIEDLSINLMLSKTRLRPEWIRNFLRDPDKYAGAGTKMPYVFYTPSGDAKVSAPEMWINYITNYLMIMEDIPQPLPEEEKKAEEEVDWTDFSY